MRKTRVLIDSFFYTTTSSEHLCVPARRSSSVVLPQVFLTRFEGIISLQVSNPMRHWVICDFELFGLITTKTKHSQRVSAPN